MARARPLHGRARERRFVLLGGPLGDGKRVLHAIEAEDEQEVRARLSTDPWHANGLLSIASVEPWTIRLDGRRRH